MTDPAHRPQGCFHATGGYEDNDSRQRKERTTTDARTLHLVLQWVAENYDIYREAAISLNANDSNKLAGFRADGCFDGRSIRLHSYLGPQRAANRKSLSQTNTNVSINRANSESLSFSSCFFNAKTIEGVCERG